MSGGIYAGAYPSGLERFEEEDLLVSDLPQLLRAALIRPQGNKEQVFLPIGKLDELITAPAVRGELRRVFSDRPLPDDDIEAIVKYVCTPHVRESAPSGTLPNLTSCRRLFAILVLIEKVHTIQSFIREGLTDRDLPFQVSYTDGRPELRRRSQNPEDLGPLLRCCRNWTQFAIESLDRYQWQTLCPIFSRADRDNSRDAVNFYPLDDQCTLPFTEDDERVSPGTPGGYSVVWRVVIHPDHHNFTSPQVS